MTEVIYRSYVSYRGTAVEVFSSEEAAEVSQRIFATEPEGTIVELRIEFGDGDIWKQVSVMSKGRMHVTAMGSTKHGLDVAEVIREAVAEYECEEG